MKQGSIRRRLLGFLLGSLVLIWALMLTISYQKAHEEIHELADIRLQQGAHTLLMLDLKRLARAARMSERNDADEKIDHEHDDEAPPLAFQVWTNEGQLLLASAGAPPAPHQTQNGFISQTIDQRNWRSYNVHDRKHDYQLTVLEPLSVRNHPVIELASRMGQVLALALPLLTLLGWLSIRHGLLPLMRISEAIRTRDACNLEPIQLQQIPEEIYPLISALNALLQRLAHSLDKERAFTADAAHELRTPLAAIKIQGEVALAAQDEATRRQAIEQVISGVNRTTHLVQQLLLLARLEHGEATSNQRVDLAQIAVDGLALRADEAGRKGIDCALEAEPGCILQGNPAMLSTLLDNLLDNAIKYGQHGNHITVNVKREPDALRLSVRDDGDGVAEAERIRLRDRFFRVEGQSAPGSGLGLSIVEKIAIAHGGTLTIDNGPGGRGLEAGVRFPVPSSA